MRVLFSSLWSLIRASRLQTFGTIMLVGALLFLSNILGVLTYNTHIMIENIQPKLGMFFYLDDDLNTQVDELSSITLIEELKEAGLEVSFYTKQQAFDRLSQQLPDILDDLEKYGIENPLPPTLYVLFRSEREFQMMKSIMGRYDSLISNAEELHGGVRFSDQEKRIQTMINGMNAGQKLGIGLIVVVMTVIVSFLLYSTTISVSLFHEQISLEKLLGASSFQIMFPFMAHVFLIILGGFLIFLLGRELLLNYLTSYTVTLFQTNFAQMALPSEGLMTILMLELGVVLSVSWIASSIVLTKLLAKVK